MIKLKIDFGWRKQSKYCLKANWIDKTHSRNIVTANIVAKIQEKYNLFNESPNHGLIDGFLIEVYVNNEFFGLYTMNIQKDTWLFNMDDDNPNNIVVAGNEWTKSVLFKEEETYDGNVWYASLYDLDVSYGGLYKN